MAGFGRARRAAIAVGVGCLTLMAAGCTGGPSHPAAHRATPAQAGPTSSAHSAPPGLAVGAQRRALAARYLAIAEVGNRRLDAEFGRLHGRDRRNLAAAHHDLLQVAATERQFDRRLKAITFPATTARFAGFLYWVNQARASMTAAAASSRSLAQLRADERRLTQANKPVEQAVEIIRSQLGLPPPETS